MKRILILASLALVGGTALAKLPALSDDAKAKAAEAAARAAWTDKVAAYRLCQSMDRTAAYYFADAKKANRDVKPAVATAPCTDPGAFAPAPPAQKAMQGAEAHSPPGTAATPPTTGSPGTTNPAAAAASPKKP